MELCLGLLTLWHKAVLKKTSAEKTGEEEPARGRHRREGVFEDAFGEPEVPPSAFGSQDFEAEQPVVVRPRFQRVDAFGEPEVPPPAFFSKELEAEQAVVVRPRFQRAVALCDGTRAHDAALKLFSEAFRPHRVHAVQGCNQVHSVGNAGRLLH
jgi:hypothetical protein